MTRWVTPGRQGRERGPAALLRAWVGVMVSPRRFFGAAVAPGDQVPGLTFAVGVAAVAATTHVALAPVPTVFPGRPLASRIFLVGALVVLVAPLALHLAAAVETVALVALAPDRGGVSQTVQVVGYATAPCALAGLPAPSLQVACALYGGALLAVGTSEVHATSLPRAAVAAALPAALVFGYGYRGFTAAATLSGL